MSFNVKALGAFRKLGAVALITATLAMCFTACKQTSGGGGGGTQGAPFVEGGASLILSPDSLTIRLKAKTEDGSAIEVEGCTETTLKSDVETELHAKGTKVVLKGNITELVCVDNQLTALNVQGCTALHELYCGYNRLTSLGVQGLTALQTLWCYANNLLELNVQGCTSLIMLWCYANHLNAQVMTEILNALPSRTAGDNAEVVLYAEYSGEGNCKDYNTPADLKKAFDEAKSRNWKLQKRNASGDEVDI